MNKKGAELTLNVMIIAILVLIVLAVVLFIFSGRIKIFGSGLKDCASLSGKCYEDSDYVETVSGKISCKKGTTVPDTNCGEGRACCIVLS